MPTNSESTELLPALPDVKLEGSTSNLLPRSKVKTATPGRNISLLQGTICSFSINIHMNDVKILQEAYEQIRTVRTIPYSDLVNNYDFIIKKVSNGEEEYQGKEQIKTSIKVGDIVELPDDKGIYRLYKVTEGQYKPYTGGAGPDDEQIHNNNLALSQELTKLGINNEVKKIKLPHFDHEMETVIFSIKEKLYEASYDRWGYVMNGVDNDNNFDSVDQCSLEHIIAIITKLQLAK